MRFQFFVDFDGTIAMNDVGNAFFIEFGTSTDHYLLIEAAWLRGEISSDELYNAACKSIRITPERFQKFLSKQDIDAAFLPLLENIWLNEEKIIVLSDGFENYITPILQRFAIKNLEVCANTFAFHREQETIVPHFPYLAQSCGKCANCKGYHVKRLRDPSATTVYIGDGSSDRCGAVECDYIFAKNDLADYCTENQVDFLPFRDFHDVIKGIETIRNRRRAG
ncbi:MAG: MtnX-like HAD-IB family phosphatase [bacterium]